MQRVGLALGGGIVRGLAHIGVLAALEEAGVPIDCVAGTSVGAIIAAVYCAGWPVARISKEAETFRWHNLLRPVWPKRGFFTFEPLADWMREEMGELDFEQLQCPCAVVATDIKAGEPVIFSSGPLIPAVQASHAVPVFIEPIELNGRLYGEGGVTDMLPVSALRQMGADYVIAVDLFAFSIRRRLGPLGFGLAALEVLLQRSGCGLVDVDCLIQPDLSGKTYLRFSKYPELFELGRQAALKSIDQIHADLGDEKGIDRSELTGYSEQGISNSEYDQ